MMGPKFYYESAGDPGITPLTRKENFLAKIAGLDSAKDLTPIKREEYFLDQIAENAGKAPSEPEIQLVCFKRYAGSTVTIAAGSEYRSVLENTPFYKENDNGAPGTKSYTIPSNLVIDREVFVGFGVIATSTSDGAIAPQFVYPIVVGFKVDDSSGSGSNQIVYYNHTTESLSVPTQQNYVQYAVYGHFVEQE